MHTLRERGGHRQLGAELPVFFPLALLRLGAVLVDPVLVEADVLDGVLAELIAGDERPPVVALALDLGAFQLDPVTATAVDAVDVFPVVVGVGGDVQSGGRPLGPVAAALGLLGEVIPRVHARIDCEVGVVGVVVVGRHRQPGIALIRPILLVEVVQMLAGGGVLVGGQFADYARTRRHQPGKVLVVLGGPELAVVALDVVPHPRAFIQRLQLVDVLVVLGRRGRMVVHPHPVGVVGCPDGFSVVVHPILVASGTDRLQNVAGLVLVVAAVIELALLGDVVGLTLGVHDRVVVGILRRHRQAAQVFGHGGLDEVCVADAVGGAVG